MEQQSRRNQFINELLIKVFVKMDLTDQILSHLYEDQDNPCKKLMDTLKKLDNKVNQKLFILLEYTKDREPVQYLAKILRENHQESIADDLEKYNQSEDFIEYTSDEFLAVRQSDQLKSGGSCRFEMESVPRGFCLILVNEKDLEPQAKQTANIFTQMYFHVRVEHMMTALQIEQLFDEVAKNDKYKGYNALITIVMGHGGDGLLCGKNFKKDPKDKVPIPHLIDQFADECTSRKCILRECAKNNCNLDDCTKHKCTQHKGINFENKPKIHIFDCCRNRNCDKIVDLSQVDSTLLSNINYYNQDWVNTNTNTTVIYSCAEGQFAEYNDLLGFSYFGRSLTHVIAQYACEQSLDELIKTITKRLEKDGIKQTPEVINYKARWHLYFNPGRMNIFKK